MFLRGEIFGREEKLAVSTSNSGPFFGDEKLSDFIAW